MTTTTHPDHVYDKFGHRQTGGIHTGAPDACPECLAVSSDPSMLSSSGGPVDEGSVGVGTVLGKPVATEAQVAAFLGDAAAGGVPWSELRAMRHDVGTAAAAVEHDEARALVQAGPDGTAEWVTVRSRRAAGVARGLTGVACGATLDSAMTTEPRDDLPATELPTAVGSTGQPSEPSSLRGCGTPEKLGSDGMALDAAVADGRAALADLLARVGSSDTAEPATAVVDPGRAPSYVYAASSWRCPTHPAIVADIRAAGVACYDFRNPEAGTGFAWTEVMPSFDIDEQLADAVEYLDGLDHPRSVEGFASDFDAMNRADIFVLVLPCNRSAHLELGWAVGAGRRTAVLLDPDEHGRVVPELMYKMVDLVTADRDELLAWVAAEATA